MPASARTSSRGRARRPRFDLEALLQALEAAHGRSRPIPRFDPVEELVCCILSQHTADKNSFPAFTRLLEAYPTWPEVVAAGPEAVAAVVRKAGLANQKARAIVGCLAEIEARNGGHTLENLRRLPLPEARSWLASLPGVGPKTAAIVLLFALGLPAIPVDTHVLRVCRRLGLLPKGIDADRAHDVLEGIVPPVDAHRFHVALIQHGRKVCRAPTPRCGECPVTRFCRQFQREGPPSRSGARA